jgi:predicted transcriptional regulator
MKKRVSHKNRYRRREEVVAFVKSLLEDLSTSNQDAFRYPVLAANKFGVSASYVIDLCKQAGIQKVKYTTKQRKVYSKKQIECMDLLRTTDYNLSQIGKQVGLTKERVRQIYEELKLTENIPARGLSFTNQKSIKKQEEFIADFIKTGDFFQSRKNANISTPMAQAALRESKLNTKIPQKYVLKKRPISRSIRIIADLFDESLTIGDIAAKHNCANPIVTMLRQDCITAGIPLPDGIPDGRLSPQSKMIRTITLLAISFHDKSTGRKITDFIWENFPPLKNIPKNRCSIVRSKLLAEGLIASTDVSGTAVYTLTEKGKESASLITDELVSELINDFLMSRNPIGEGLTVH